MPSLAPAALLGAFRRRWHAGSPRWGLRLVVGLLLVAALAPLAAPSDPYLQLDPEATALRPPGTAMAAVHVAGGGWQNDALAFARQMPVPGEV